MIRFVKLQEEHLQMVMGWRTNPEIARHMLTQVDYDLEKQHNWFHKISGNDSYRYWVIHYNDVPIGLINLADIDRANRRCTVGYYIGESEYRNVGAMVPPFLYNYVFKKMDFRKIYGEANAENANILRIHALHGWRQVGVCRDHIFKDGRFHDVIIVELLAESWLKQKRYQRDIAEFE